MDRRHAKRLALCLITGLAYASSTWVCPAQTPASLGLQIYSGLSITGAVGSVYSIEYVSDLAQSNSWQSLVFLQLPTSPYLWTDQTTPATAKRFYRATLFNGPTNMVFIPPGTFRMGSPDNEVGRSGDEGPQTAVIISSGFWMGINPITQGDYQALMGNNPSWFSTNSGFSQDLSRPVEQVSWFDATNYCWALTQQERAAGRIPTSCVYRLPTEAEWEYSCRAWTSTRFSYGDDPGYLSLTNYAWYSANSGAITHDVGQKLPNLWGLYDMQGNVWQWCQDWYNPVYAGGIAIDPQGLDSGTYRVFRGGSWFVDPPSCRAAARGSIYPTNQGRDTGFRVLLAPAQ